MTALIELFGECEKATMPELRKTSFPRAEPGTRDYLDDMLEATRQAKNEPDYLPDPGTRERWQGQARRLFRGHGYRSGFIQWALPMHLDRFRKQGEMPITTGPLSLEYLFDAYGQVSGPGYGGWISTEED